MELLCARELWGLFWEEVVSEEILFKCCRCCYFYTGWAWRLWDDATEWYIKCLQHGFIVKRETIRELLSIQDPVSVAFQIAWRLRQWKYCNPGPNFLWHVDRYDKLKSYGLCISGCVDGFSRRVVWPQVYSTNNNPRVILSYLVEAVKARHGCPRTIRFDRGTENVDVEQMQRFFRWEGSGKTVLFCSSNHNQRMESFWSILRKEKVQF